MRFGSMVQTLKITLLAALTAMGFHAFAQPTAPATTAQVTDTLQSAPNTSTTTVKTDDTTKTPKTITGSWNLALRGYRFEDSFNQKTTTEFILGGDLTYHALPMVSFDLAPKFAFTSGYYQTEAATNANQSVWSVKNASV